MKSASDKKNGVDLKYKKEDTKHRIKIHFPPDYFTILARRRFLIRFSLSFSSGFRPMIYKKGQISTVTKNGNVILG